MPPDLSPELPRELEAAAGAVLRRYDRGLLTDEERDDGLLDAAHTVAGRELQRSAGAAEVAEVAEGRAEAELAASYALALAAAYDEARGLAEWVFRSPQWRQALDPVRARLSEAVTAGAGTGAAALAEVASLGWTAARRGVLPGVVREVVRRTPPVSEAGMIDLLESDREGDAERVAEIVRAFGARGCVSPALHVLRLRRSESRPVAASALAALLDPADLAARGELGGITHVAVELLADGADEPARSWSAAVDHTRVFHAPEQRPTIYSGWDPYLAYDEDRRQRDHGPGRCLRWCNSGDARLLGALATVDQLTGDVRRARERAAACDRGADPTGWSASGVELLAEWVLSQQLAPPERRRALTEILDHAGRSHVHLGLLGAQVHAELAELATDPEAVAGHRAAAERFRARPELRLHFESFQLPALLGRLPLGAATGPRARS